MSDFSYIMNSAAVNNDAKLNSETVAAHHVIRFLLLTRDNSMIFVDNTAANLL